LIAWDIEVSALREQRKRRQDSAEPLSVLHVIAPASVGGAESVVVQLSSGLRAHGHDARVAVVLDPVAAVDHPFVKALSTARIPVELISVTGRQYLAERRAVSALLRDRNVDVLHTHGYRPDLVTAGITRAENLPHVTTMHGFVSGGFRDRVYEWFQVAHAIRASAAIAVSAPVFERLRNAGGGSSIRLIPNAVAPVVGPLSRETARAELGLPDAIPLVAWIGRFSHEKGPDIFVRALPKVAALTHAVMIGDGPCLSNARSDAQALGVSSRIHFTGVVAGASRYLAAFDAIVLTSRTEGTPMVVLEAMRASVPVISSRVGGVPDMLSANEGILCPPEDADAIADAVNGVIADPVASRAMAAKAHSRALRDFSFDGWINAHTDLYRELIASTGD
jgi:glycosyltransferase involved in cell wall biosynthesis